MVQGTNGIWMDLDERIYLDGKSPDHEWEPLTNYMEKYEHPLWKKYAETASKSGHGGNDFFIMNAFVGAVKDQAPAPLDVYDAASWSAITPLSEQSIANGSEPVAFPDFTRGDWMKRKPSFGFSGEY